MLQAAITAAVRRAIREPLPVTVTDTEIAATTLRGVLSLGNKIKAVNPSHFVTRKSISSNTPVFARPSDCLTIRRVWDLGTNAITITGASNASPIVITATAHGFADDDILTVHDVGGTTAANGTWLTTYITANTFSLDDSVGNAAYSSGGKVYEETSNYQEMRKISHSQSTGQQRYCWYPRGSSIVVDYLSFTYDILVDYIYRPSAITDIPDEFHEGLISYCVIDHITMPDRRSPTFGDMNTVYNYHMQRLNRVYDEITAYMRASDEPVGMPGGIDWNSLVGD